MFRGVVACRDSVSVALDRLAATVRTAAPALAALLLGAAVTLASAPAGAQADPAQEARLLWAAGNQVGATHWAAFVDDRESTRKGLHNIVELYRSTACLDPAPWQALLDELQAGASARSLFPKIVALEDAVMATSGIAGYVCPCQKKPEPGPCDLSGHWSFFRPEEPQWTFPARITQIGSGLTVETLEARHEATLQGCAKLLDRNRLPLADVADGGNRIIWSNGYVYVRAQHGLDLLGDWLEANPSNPQQRLVDRIFAGGPKLLVETYARHTASLHLKDGGATLWCPEWNLTAAIVDGGRRLDWFNGVVWVRP